MLVAMSAKSPRTAIRKVIRFQNEDVPNYLRKLDKFEEVSKGVCLAVG